MAEGGRSLPLQLSLAIAKSPDGTALVTWSATVFGLLKVVVLAALVAPTTTPPKLNVSWVMLSLPATPTALSAAEPAFGFASSLTESKAILVPSAAGVKVSIRVQLAPCASVEPQPLLAIVNSL